MMDLYRVFASLYFIATRKGCLMIRHSSALGIVSVLALLLSLISAPSFADTIVNTLPVDTTGGYGGYWFGTSAFNDTYVVAERFTTYRDFSQITGEALLSTNFVTGGTNQFPTVSFSLVADNAGIPGSALSTTSVTLTNTAPTLYSMAFTNLILGDATSYWLVASSNAVGDPGQTGPATWVKSSAFYEGGQTALNLNGTWAEFLNFSTGFALFGTETGDPINNGSGPITVPEPSSLFLLGSGIAMLAGFRRKLPPA